ncbi:MAG TPA: HlyD family efflux transporter periplasmic adaptor subunit [Rubricoccaceae bacterium]|jgi:multidrug resistance efflux pump
MTVLPPAPPRVPAAAAAPLTEAPAWAHAEAARRGAAAVSTALLAAQTPHLARRLTVFLVLLGVAIVAALVFTPWRQVVAGSGSVTSFDPAARPQTVEALVDGRVARWAVAEGARAEAGAVIAELQDIGSGFLDQDFVARTEQGRAARIQAAVLAVDAARVRQATAQAEQRLIAARATATNADAEQETARVRADRADALAADGLVATRDVETARLALQKADRDLDARHIAEAEAAQRVAQATAETDLGLGNARGRAENAVVRAPVAGTVVRIAQVGTGQTVKAGDVLATVVPDTEDQAVEVFVSDRDAALVEPGRAVRLQFAGYPALMLTGLPGLSIGVFGGRVAVVDAVDDGTGRFRLLVTPDSSGAPWPPRRFLRQGSSATGWVLLGEVSLGYELWRRMNGLPPQIPVRGATTTPEDGAGYESGAYGSGADASAKPPAARLK